MRRRHSSPERIRRVPDEVVVASAGVRSEFVSGGVRGRPELQVLPWSPAQGDVDGTRHIEVRMSTSAVTNSSTVVPVGMSGGRPHRAGDETTSRRDRRTSLLRWAGGMPLRRERRCGARPDPTVRHGERDTNRVILRARFGAARPAPRARPPGPANGWNVCAGRHQRAVRDGAVLARGARPSGGESDGMAIGDGNGVGPGATNGRIARATG